MTRTTASASEKRTRPAGNPGEAGISPRKQRDMQEIYEKVREAAPKLIGSNGKTDSLPKNVHSFLCRVLGELNSGNSITILQNDAQLTTIDASKMLGISRQFLVTLLEKGEIPFFKVGTHRRLYARDVLAYKARRDASRRKALDDLARAEFEAGVYDKVPGDFNTR